MAREESDPAKVARAHSVFVRLVLPPYTIHFKSPTYMKETTLELLDKKVCKETVKNSASSAAVREAIGTDPRYWSELVVLIRAAVTSLERRSFSIWDPTSVDYESTSGALIASHYPGLWRDLERINDLISISRNVLTAGDRVQDLAAEHGVEHEVFRLINCAVRVTARGYDGDAGTGEEEKWQWIVNAYKKLLITSLQLLNNLVAQNERRKLMLWVNLFDSTSDAVLDPEDNSDSNSTGLRDTSAAELKEPKPPLSRDDILVAYGLYEKEPLDLSGAEPLVEDEPWTELPEQAVRGKPTLATNGYVYFVRRSLAPCIEDYWRVFNRPPTPAEIYLDMPGRWAQLSPDDQATCQYLWEEAEQKYRTDLGIYETKLALLAERDAKDNNNRDLHHTRIAERKIVQLEEQLSERYKSELPQVVPMEPPVSRGEGALNWSQNKGAKSKADDQEDLNMLFTAEAGTKILESGKAELMKRLEGFEKPEEPATAPMPPGPSPPVPRAESQSLPDYRTQEVSDDPLVTDDEDLVEGEAWSVDSEEEERLREQEGSEEAEEEEEYPGSTEDGRGLLTDVPLILGPSEIEVLPMIVMSGISPPHQALAQCTTVAEENALINMHTVRCHLLFAQDNGRNLLRELLIFVAAWDLREEELYFKFMVKIMEAILANGLMPYAYHAFRDRSRSKDIISPAQAVIMKLLTNIFRARSEANKAAASNAGANHNTNIQSKAQQQLPPASSATGSARPSTTPRPHRVEIHILNFIFTEFRQHIIPQTCALIFLQGQIHAGRASPEDFPLNLWDMERMYEGVYQYLEFFAVLTEEGFWKQVLGGWEIASELVTLLRELEGGIPKLQIHIERVAQGQQAPSAARRVSAPSISTQQQPERANSADARVPSHATGTQPQEAVSIERPFDVTSPDPTLLPSSLQPGAQAAATANSQHQQQQPHQQQQSAIFEPETPLAYPEDAQDEPSDFEWRNLKKLTVLVLSSLIWKNRLVQDQVRRYGGLEALVSCCRQDEHNPYIREHAIMCLRFAVEDNEENASVIRKMAGVKGSGQQRGRQALKLPSSGNGQIIESEAPIEDVPREVLDANGYETFMDGRGQIGLRRKEQLPPASTLASNAGQAVPSSSSARPMLPPMQNAGMAKLTPEKAAELMQAALKELPLGVGASLAEGLRGLTKGEK